MPSWADENGRYWWGEVEIPHAPVTRRPGECDCAFCQSHEPQRERNITNEEMLKVLDVPFCFWTDEDGEPCPVCKRYHMRGHTE